MSRRFVLTVEIDSERDDVPRKGDVIQDGSEGLQGYHARVIAAWPIRQAEGVADPQPPEVQS